jgi:hypothetical protein
MIWNIQLQIEFGDFDGSYSIRDLLHLMITLLLISIGFFIVMSNVKRKLAYGMMGLLNGISSPLYVYFILSTTNFNLVFMDLYITSTTVGTIGVIIGIIGIFIEIKSKKLRENKFVFNLLIILQIALWVISMLYAESAPYCIG